MAVEGADAPTVFWINLDSDAGRREHMERQLGGRVRHERVAAARPADLGVLRGAGGRSPEETACLCSHLEALRRASLLGAPWALVAEDDVSFPWGPRLSCSGLSRSAPAGAEALQLCSVCPGLYAGGPARGLWVPWAPHHYGTQLYAVRPAAARRLLGELGVDPGGGPLLSQLGRGRGPDLSRLVGEAVADDCIYRMCRTYTCTAPVAVGDASMGSSIHPGHLGLHERAWRAALAASRAPGVAAGVRALFLPDAGL